MKIAKFNPRPNTNFVMDRFFNEDFFKPFFDDEFLRPSFRNHVFGATVPFVNIAETTDSFRIEVAAPGQEKDDFKVNLDKNLLKISVKNETNPDASKDNYRRREFNFSSFERSFRLPETVDRDKIDAKYINGVLNIILPKLEAAIEKPARDIEIG
ncbi:MAG: Hsp20/alpha crystallin family protein [Bacteroidota bacterium]